MKSNISEANNKKSGSISENAISDFSSNKVPFAVIEAYKNIRNSVVTKMNKNDYKVLSITSANASAGKSTTSINVAIAISKLNKKVLLLDADIHRPTVAKKLRLINNKGFIDVILGACEFENAVKKYNPYLDVLTSGIIMNNPTEVFNSEIFDEFISELKNKYDYIIIDTPPVNIISDTLVIAQKSDAVAIIIRPKLTTHDCFKNTMECINDLNINLLGVIINGDKINSSKYLKYNKYHY